MDIFDLAARITLDTAEYEQGVKNASNQASGFGSSWKSAAVVAGAAFTAIVAGIGSLVKSTVSAYAENEQLIGGVKTLFQGSAEKVKEYAANAYKTAGISANEYMSQVTSFAASLVNSLGTTTEQVEGAVTQATIDALNNNLEATQAAQEKSLDVKIRAQEDEYEAFEKAEDNKINLLQKSQEKELEDYEKLVDEKIKLIDKQYNENLKLIDEEKYNRLQAVQAEIDAINAEQAADDKAALEREQNAKKAALQEKVNNAKTDEELRKAREDLNAYLADLEAKRVENERKARVDALKAQKEDIKKEAEEKKAELKAQRDEEVAAEQEKSAAKIKEMKESHSKELDELKEAKKEQLKELKRSQQDELSTIKQGNTAKLAAMKSYIAEQKKLVSDGTTTVIKKDAEVYEKAADIADMAMGDMADNVNKMGSSMESIQNAYQGFAKQNYTMLDNLKLGYGGTREEMQRLLDDAGRIAETKFELDNFADIAQAIHVIQGEMKITGTTVSEAKDTISGSVAAAKAAWENLVVGMSDENADYETLVSNFVETASTAAENIIPRVEQALSGIGAVVTALAPKIIEKIPEFVGTVIPNLLSAGKDLITGLKQGLIDNKQEILDAGTELIKALADGLPEAISFVIESTGEIITAIIDELSKVDWIATGEDILVGLGTGLENIFSSALGVIDGLLGTNLKEWYAEVQAFWFDAGAKLYEVLHADELESQQVKDRANTLSTDIKLRSNELMRSGMSVEEALAEAQREILQTAEDVAAFNRYGTANMVESRERYQTLKMTGQIAGEESFDMGEYVEKGMDLWKSGAVTTFIQNINSPKELSRDEIARDTQELLEANATR